LQPVVAERALPDAPVVLALIQHAERARRHAVAAPVAHVLLYDDRPELGPEESAGRTHLEARRLRAVLADVRRHEPPHTVALLVGRKALALDQPAALRRLYQRRTPACICGHALLDE